MPIPAALDSLDARESMPEVPRLFRPWSRPGYHFSALEVYLDNVSARGARHHTLPRPRQTQLVRIEALVEVPAHDFDAERGVLTEMGWKALHRRVNGTGVCVSRAVGIDSTGKEMTRHARSS